MKRKQLTANIKAIAESIAAIYESDDENEPKKVTESNTISDQLFSALEDGSVDWETFGREAIQQMSSDEIESVAEAIGFEPMEDDVDESKTESEPENKTEVTEAEVCEGTPEQAEANRQAEEAKKAGKYYAIGYYDSSNSYPEFMYSDKDENSILENAEADFKEGYYETINVCDPSGHVVKSFSNDDDDGWPSPDDVGWEDSGMGW